MAYIRGYYLTRRSGMYAGQMDGIQPRFDKGECGMKSLASKSGIKKQIPLKKKPKEKKITKEFLNSIKNLSN